MRVHHRAIRDVNAVIISHDHADHIRCAGIYQRKFGLPIYMTRPTHTGCYTNLGPLRDIRYFKASEPLRFDGVTVHTIPTPHDAADGCAFVIEHDGKRLGIMTDLGHPFPELVERIPTLDACYLESNYDPDMLTNGPYPYHLQQRIRGGRGHLSNFQAAELIQANCKKLKWAALAHLSEENNDPTLALDTHRKHTGKSFPFFHASRYEVSEIMEI